MFTTGNSETTTVTAGLRAARKTGKNKLSLEGNLTYARSGLRAHNDLDGDMVIDGPAEIITISSITAETLSSKIRYDRFLTKYNSLFVAALASRDLPAGKEAVLGGQLGYSRQLFKSEKTEAVAELGYDFSYEDLIDSADGDSNTLSIHSARAFLGLKSEMAAGTILEASSEVLTNLNAELLPTCPDMSSEDACEDYATIGKDTRLLSRVSVSSKLTKNLSVQTSLEIKFDNRPAPMTIKGMLAPGFVPEASKIDTMMKASLIYTIL